MKLWVIAKREIQEYQLILVLGVFGLIAAILVPWLNGFSVQNNPDKFVLAVIALALTTSIGIAMYSGANLMAQEMEAGRFGFYLSRPLTNAQILWGKVLGGMSLAILGGLIVLLPGLWPLKMKLKELAACIGVMVIGDLFVLFAFHMIAVAVRSKTAWIVVDLLAVSVMGATLWRCLNQLGVSGAFGAGVWLIASFVGGLFVILMVATWLQVSLARGDLKIGHRILSVTVVSYLCFYSLLGVLITRRILNPNASDLRSAHVMTTGQNWIALTGRAPGFWNQQLILLHDTQGRHPDRVMKGNIGILRIASDDSRAVWEGWDQGQKSIWVMELSRPDQTPRSIKLDHCPSVYTFHLSPDGKYAAILGKESLQLVDLDAGSARSIPGFHGDAVSRLLFLSQSRLRLFGHTPMSDVIDIQELDLVTGELVRTGKFEERGRLLKVLEVDSSRDCILVSCRVIRNGNIEADTLWLCRGSDGVRLAKLLDSEPQRVNAHFLEDGRIFVKCEREGRVKMLLLSHEGKETAQWEIGLQSYLPGVPEQKTYAWFAGERVPGHVWLGVNATTAENAEQGRYVDLELATGRISPVENLRPLPQENWRVENRNGPDLHLQLYRGLDGAIVLKEQDGKLRKLTHPGKFEFPKN